MSTSPSSLASTAASLTAPPTFTGVSKFASSLQQVLTRAEGIASLPLDSLNAGLTTLQNQQSAASSLNSTFSSLQQSIASLQTSLCFQFASSAEMPRVVSDGSVVSATIGHGALAGTYSIEAEQPRGPYSTALSLMRGRKTAVDRSHHAEARAFQAHRRTSLSRWEQRPQRSPPGFNWFASGSGDRDQSSGGGPGSGHYCQCRFHQFTRLPAFPPGSQPGDRCHRSSGQLPAHRSDRVGSTPGTLRPAIEVNGDSTLIATVRREP